MSGGYSPSMLDAMRFAITVSNILSLSKPEGYKPLNFKDVFFMATLGGAFGNYFCFAYIYHDVSSFIKFHSSSRIG